MEQASNGETNFTVTDATFDGKSIDIKCAQKQTVADGELTFITA